MASATLLLMALQAATMDGTLDGLAPDVIGGHDTINRFCEAVETAAERESEAKKGGSK